MREIKDPIRVLHATVVISPGGGTETFLMNLYRNIDRSKVQFDFLTSIEGSFEEEIKEMGGRVYRVPHILKVGPLVYRRNLAAFFNAHREYLIVHSHMDKMGGLVLDEARKAGVPIRIAHSHSTDCEGGWFERKVKQYYGRYLRRVPTDRMACSADAGSWLFPGATDKVTLLKNGIVFDDYRFSEETRRKKRAELGLNEEEKVLFHVGRFDKAKNQRFALEVFKALDKDQHKDAGNCRMLFAGTGYLLDVAKKHAKDMGVDDKVQFLGLRNDVPGLMMAADAFVFPSIYEGLSVTLIEAQASGLPCLITDTLAEESIVRPELVKQLPLGDAAAWATAVRDIITINVTRTMTSVRWSEYDIKNIAVELEQFYIQRASEVGQEFGYAKS